MTVQLVLALVYVVGCALTIYNGVSAFIASERRLRRYAGRVKRSDRYAQESANGAAEVTGRRTHGESASAAHEPTAHELAQHLVDTFYENRTKLVLAGIGLVLTTAASIVSLFV